MNKPFFDPEREIRNAEYVMKALTRTLVETSPEKASLFLKGGYQQPGYGVGVGASLHGSFAIEGEGNQGYYVDGGAKFRAEVLKWKQFLAHLKENSGKPVRLIEKFGIGGQQTAFQAIADLFAGLVTNSADHIHFGTHFELGSDPAELVASKLNDLHADWDQYVPIASSKSGSTDETMILFVQILRRLFVEAAKVEGLEDAEGFAEFVLQSFHLINFTSDGRNMKEKPATELFSLSQNDPYRDFLAMLSEKARSYGFEMDYEKAKKIFRTALCHLFLETTDRPDQSRLAAFIHRSGLADILGVNGPAFGEMFDNVGGRWTGDLHMMPFLAALGLNEDAYWKQRRQGIEQVRKGEHPANLVGNLLLNEGVTDIALLVPDEAYWFGKTVEQNFNESVWQDGYINLVAVRVSDWEGQAGHYRQKKNRRVLNLTALEIPVGPFQVIELLPMIAERLSVKVDEKFVFNKLRHEQLSIVIAEMFTFFYGLTTQVGNRLIARAIENKGLKAEQLDIQDLQNSATQILQENLYLRQPFVELGKSFLSDKLETLQKDGKKGLLTAWKEMSHWASEGRVEIDGKGKSALAFPQGLKVICGKALDEGRKIVPVLYLEGQKFVELRNELLGPKIACEWVMQGTCDQHISMQQVLACPEKYLPVIIAFIPEHHHQGDPAIGFGKGFLHEVDPSFVRAEFACATYQALTQPVNAGGRGGAALLYWIHDNVQNRGKIKMAFEAVKKEFESFSADTSTQGNIRKALGLGSIFSLDFLENISDFLIEEAIASGATEFTMNPYSTGNYIQHLLALQTDEAESVVTEFLQSQTVQEAEALLESLDQDPALQKALKAAFEPTPLLTPATAMSTARKMLESMVKESKTVAQKVQEISSQPDCGGEALYWEITEYFAIKIADRVKGFYDDSKGLTGFLSVEVDPRIERPKFLADLGYEGSPADFMKAQASRLKELRPNVLVKVPASPAGYQTVQDIPAHYNVTLQFADDDSLDAVRSYQLRQADFFILRNSPFVSRNAVWFADYWLQDMKHLDGHAATIANTFQVFDALRNVGFEDSAIWSSLGIKIKGDPGWLYAWLVTGRAILNMPPATAYDFNQAPDVPVERLMDEKASLESVLIKYFSLVYQGKIPSAQSQFKELFAGTRSVEDQASLASEEWRRLCARPISAERITALKQKYAGKAFTLEGLAKAEELIAKGEMVSEKMLMRFVLKAEGEEKFIQPFQAAVDRLDLILNEIRI